jgi:FPC/CPF motif-containing protein YcgG
MSEYTTNHSRMGYFVSDASFPCVAAKSARAHQNIMEITYHNLKESSEDAEILDHVEQFMASTNGGEGLRSFVAAFQGPLGLSELEFEQAMWERLQALHDLDAKTCEWDGSVSCDPASPDFSFSLRGKAFFVIGLHPNSSRRSRRYWRPALVFNLHEQFETLRRQGRYDRMRDVIRKRDASFCGSMNPALRNFGDRSEAAQYSGRAVRDDWRCPFTPKCKRWQP